ncbi:MAG: polysaccharide deacetylase family protein [Prevotellaceae bacterium]|jgi:peptidoglycan/xylan/chitin deacetylase (PgdA/CDA1 family)|nr:polysaccharide deacetylase family protein [Prevotellaceae bacterium]
MELQFPSILRSFLGNRVWRKNPKERKIYLTFDDGPVPEVTPLVLDILDEYAWKATFFCIGENVKKHPGLYQEILERGHKTGNHTFNHLKGKNTGLSEYCDNVKYASKYIDSKLFRPPYGKMTQEQQKKLATDYEIIMWDIISYDYSQRLLPDEVLSKVKRHSRNGSIVVFHDSIKAKNNVLAALPQAIEFWNSQQYEYGLL